MSYNRDDLKEKIIDAVNKSKTLAAAHRNFFPEMNVKTFRKLCKELDVFIPNPSKKGTTLKDDYPELYEKNKEKFLEKLVPNSTYQSNKLRNLLLKYNIKQPICECCKNTVWNGRNIPLEVHHINGNKCDNRLENLMILCPNCHAQTENFKSKNKFYKNAK